MLPVTDRFLAALRESHTVTVAARLYRPEPLNVPTTLAPIEVPVTGGQVTIDRDARIRRQATLEVAFSLADEFTADVVRELPFGGEAVIERGIRYADGTSERVTLGTFRVESVVWDELQGNATLTLADRMAQVEDTSFLWPVAPTGSATAAATQYIADIYGTRIAYVNEGGAGPALTGATVYEEDRAQAVADLAASADCWAYFTAAGDFKLALRDPAPTGPVWTLDAGERGTLLSVSETLDRSSVRNGVIAKGQVDADQPPIYGMALHTDPASPTRWAGPFGQVALHADLAAVTSQAQADSVAASLLGLRLGLARSVILAAVPNPALEPDDVIEIVFPDGRVEQHTINAVSIGLDADSPLELATTSQYLPALAGGRARAWGRTAWAEVPA